MTHGERICTRCGQRGHVAASCPWPAWLPTETQVRAAIERQRAEALRHGARLDGPESIYLAPGVRQQHTQPARASWWRRLLHWMTNNAAPRNDWTTR
jgi:hypothetical protein